MTDRNSVGIIGLGLLGSALAERLIRAGYRVAGFDIDRARRAEFADCGGMSVDAAAELASAPRLVLSLPDADVSERVIADIEHSLRPGGIIVDTTTGNPRRMAALGQRLAAREVSYLDATVGGSSEQCRRGEVIVIAGGDPQAFETCGDLFASFAKQSFHVGPCGCGARMKLVLNLVLGLNRAVLAEGLSLAKRFGLDPQRALEILQAGPACSAVMQTKGSKMLTEDFAPQARLSQHLKDVRLILANGLDANAQLPMTQLHESLLQALVDRGFGNADNAAIIKAFAIPADSE